MAGIPKRFFFAPADTTIDNALYTVPTNMVAVLKSVTFAQPTGSLTTNIRISIGADGATTRVIDYTVPAGAHFGVIYPNITLNAGEVINMTSTATDDVCIVTASGTVQALTA